MSHLNLKKQTLKRTIGALVLAASWYSSAYAKPFIVGGVDVLDSDPINQSIVGLLMQTRMGTAICTASIIDQDILVTAAHCVSDERGNPIDASQLLVLFGTDLRKPREVRKVIGAIANSHYKEAGGEGKDQGDIAVIRFDGALPIGYGPAKILPKSSKLKAKQVVTLAGYGVTTMEAGVDGGAGTLRKVDTKISDPKFAKTEVLLDQRDGHGACHGDSGGPAYATVGGKQYLFGVTNRGYPDVGVDDCLQFSVYTNINAYTKFISASVKELKQLH